jgi:hypothetical protein
LQLRLAWRGRGSPTTPFNLTSFAYPMVHTPVLKHRTSSTNQRMTLTCPVISASNLRKALEPGKLQHTILCISELIQTVHQFSGGHADWRLTPSVPARGKSCCFGTCPVLRPLLTTGVSVCAPYPSGSTPNSSLFSILDSACEQDYWETNAYCFRSGLEKRYKEICVANTKACRNEAADEHRSRCHQKSLNGRVGT